jgi:quercetin dioxygenase-like cupin family protein
VRVLRIHYEPHAKSAMHSHPDSIVVVLTDATTKMGLPDGKSQTMTMKAGQTMFAPAGSHLPENIGDKPFEIIQVELKGGAAKSGAANPAPKK